VYFECLFNRKDGSFEHSQQGSLPRVGDFRYQVLTPPTLVGVNGAPTLENASALRSAGTTRARVPRFAEP
jgi:hypothetical protein